MRPIAEVLQAARFHYASELDLQDAIERLLIREGYAVVREVELDGRRDRIDLMVGSIGIEVKVAGRPDAVLRQLARYSTHEEVSELVLVTTRVRHHGFPSDLGGKPLRVVSLLAGGL